MHLQQDHAHIWYAEGRVSNQTEEVLNLMKICRLF